jgi:hypothetical protein
MENEELAFLMFKPRALRNLAPLNEPESLAPIMNIQPAQSADGMRFYALCGRGPRSSVRVLRHGLKILELAKTQVCVCLCVRIFVFVSYSACVRASGRLMKGDSATVCRLLHAFPHASGQTAVITPLSSLPPETAHPPPLGARRTQRGVDHPREHRRCE